MIFTRYESRCSPPRPSNGETPQQTKHGFRNKPSMRSIFSSLRLDIQLGIRIRIRKWLGERVPGHHTIRSPLSQPATNQAPASENLSAGGEARNHAIANLRLWVTLLVLLHHSMLAYCKGGAFNSGHYLASSAPVVDPRSWTGFDLAVDFNDTYFMALMFLISGLFVLPSCRRRGTIRYIVGRLQRLGLPFLFCVFVVMPIAYYPSFRLTGAKINFLQYYSGYFGEYGWPTGPAWFIWLLLFLDMLVAGVAKSRPGMRALNAVPSFAARYPLRFLIAVVVTVLACYEPLVLCFGSATWFSAGPFAVQVSRLGLYAATFFVGVGLGAAGVEHPVLGKSGPFARLCLRYCSLGLLSFLAFRYSKQSPDGVTLTYLRIPGSFLTDLTLVLCSVSLSAASLGLFIRYAARETHFFRALGANAYGMYILHYPFVIWGQRFLLGENCSPLTKAATTFVSSLIISWSLAAILRRFLPVRSVI